MAGGNLEVETAGDLAAPIGAFGTGDLTVYAGGNMDGRFLVKDGAAELRTMGDFGKRPQSGDQAFELFDGEISLTAQGSIALGTLVNPTIANQDFNDKWNLTYGEEALVSLVALNGDVTLSGENRFYSDRPERGLVLPPSLEVAAARDIRLHNQFYLAPSPTGNLRLKAGRDIDGQLPDGVNRSLILLSDIEPSQVYGDRTDELAKKDDLFNRIKNAYEHSQVPIHATDPVPVTLTAGRDIRDLLLYLPKKAQISAGQDLRDIYLAGQNLNKEDITTLKAARDMRFSATKGVSLTGIERFGGPGVLSVEAGNAIDLGTSRGIQTVGDFFNPALGAEKSFVAIVSGVVSDFFKDLSGDLDIAPFRLWSYMLWESGSEYSDLRQAGQLDEADEMVELTRGELISPLFEGAEITGEGNVNMVNSQISTVGSPADLLFVANGELNVGKTALGEQSRDTGIITASGGSISIFAQEDVNVNESRVMTFMGGDIAIMSNHGNINAGRGSKTAISSPPPQTVTLPTGETVVRFSPPAVGSGVRALTFDPDGEGPLEEPVLGDVNLTAPEGEIDAGEAGIAGRNVILGATEIVNAENISFSQGSVGVPVASEGGIGLGALAGAGTLAEVSKLTEETTGVASARRQVEQELADLGKTFSSRWLKVRFIGFEEE
jgi:hypothetical protein